MLNFPVLAAKETVEGDTLIPSDEQEDELSQFGKSNEPNVTAISGSQQRETGLPLIFKFWWYLKVNKIEHIEGLGYLQSKDYFQ